MFDIETTIRQMSLAEKAALCSGATKWLTKQNRKFGVPSLFMANGSYGVLMSKADRDNSLFSQIKRTAGAAATLLKLSDQPLIGKIERSTSFPCSTAVACTWNTELVHEMGKALGEECASAGVNLLLGPGINIKRTPLCGRNFEYYSEDPCLAGEIASALIEGVQSEGVGVSLKHYALNNTELRRFTVDTITDERTLREIYLAAFERVVKKARPQTIMSAYNKVNGNYASESQHLLTEILRDEWGFDGVVVSDWGAVEDRVKALAAGCDLQMPGPQDADDEKIVRAVESGELPIETLDRAVRRILTLVQRLYREKNPTVADYESHHRLAISIAEESMVLLKNNGCLPWSKEQIRSLAVIGECAENSNYLRGGSAFIQPIRMDEPLPSLQTYLDGNATVRYAAGYHVADDDDPVLIQQAVDAAKQSSAALIIARTGTFDYSEGNERTDIRLPAQQVNLIHAVTSVQPNTVVAVICGSAFACSEWESEAGAVLSIWHAGQGIGEALKNILFGIANPSGRLAETFPERLCDTPAYINASMRNDKIYYGETIFVGYRYYDKRQMAVSYPFGHGLSYTRFEYSHLTIDASAWDAAETVDVRFCVKNTGACSGKEVVQLYVRDPECFLPRPEKELKAFAKVLLEPNEEKEIRFTLQHRDFSFYHPDLGRWIAEEGAFELLVGASSRDIRLTGQFMLSNADSLVRKLDGDSLLKDWIAVPAAKEILRSELGGLLFDAFADPCGPIYFLAMTIPLRRLVNNGYLSAKQLDSILLKVRSL